MKLVDEGKLVVRDGAGPRLILGLKEVLQPLVLLMDQRISSLWFGSRECVYHMAKC